MAYITLKEYAERLGKERSVVYMKYRRGRFATARKMGRDIWIDENEPYVDSRVKSGRYVGWRDLYSTKKRMEADAKAERDSE